MCIQRACYYRVLDIRWVELIVCSTLHGLVSMSVCDMIRYSVSLLCVCVCGEWCVWCMHVVCMYVCGMYVKGPMLLLPSRALSLVDTKAAFAFTSFFARDN